MYRMTKLLLSAIAMCAIAVAAPARAGTATANLTVTANVPAKCVVLDGALAFGAYDPVSANKTAPLTQTGTFTVACTKGTPYSVALGAGGNGANAAFGATRAMKDPGTGAYLSYELYTDSTYATVWNATNQVGPGATPGTQQVGSVGAAGTSAGSAPWTFTVYGRIPGGQDADAANGYTDTVVETVNF